MPATEDQLTLLQEVNDQINAYPYVSDNALFGEAPDTWKFKPDNKGFLCRDYAVGKGEELGENGWPVMDLAVVLCYTEPLPGAPDGEYHAVLWATAGGEAWVLDNRTPAIYRWDKPVYPYRWALRQVAGTDGFLDISGAVA